ncbi:hypothetical protein DL240_11210 [Lujinxingia litoralis]|uniref:DUF362 domain-containing protein n=1 Tax=Lujinxingia litoralis TaxID=2211119 RepID=A0A328C6R2_9DELT|nr:DUF362 domain-containing protein [Lujinxingia litoralis]RAL22492.1 hypothetical protein DL240_11210 [Lujinxingia litoralis]
MDRRRFLKHLAATAALGITGAWGCAASPGLSHLKALAPGSSPPEPRVPAPATVVLVTDTDRGRALRRLLHTLEFSGHEHSIFVQPTLHDATPSPRSTHTALLASLARHCRSQACDSLHVGTRHLSRPTAPLFRAKQLPTMAHELGFDLLALDELPSHHWRIISPEPAPWQQGFALPRQVTDAHTYIQLATLLASPSAPGLHAALSGACGLLPTRHPGTDHHLLNELAACEDPGPRMLAVVHARQPDLIILDAFEIAPDEHRTEHCGVMLASTNPVAIDAVGLALLRRHQPPPELARGPVHEFPLLAHASEFPRIELSTDARDRPLADALQALLRT